MHEIIQFRNRILIIWNEYELRIIFTIMPKGFFFAFAIVILNHEKHK